MENGRTVSELAAHGKSTDPHWFHQICQEKKTTKPYYSSKEA